MRKSRFSLGALALVLLLPGVGLRLDRLLGR